MSTDFKLEHNFPNIPLEKFIAHLNDPALNDMLKEALDFEERTLLIKKENHDSVLWQFKVKKKQALPSAIKKVLKDDAFSWQESSRFVQKENCIYWSISPQIKALKFFGEGTWQLTRYRQGTKRIIEGKITVDIPLVGKVVETFIVNELLKTYEIEPKVQEKFYSHVS